MMATISPGTASPELGRRICLRTCVVGSTTCSGQGAMSTMFHALSCQPLPGDNTKAYACSQGSACCRVCLRTCKLQICNWQIASHPSGPWQMLTPFKCHHR